MHPPSESPERGIAMAATVSLLAILFSPLRTTTTTSSHQIPAHHQDPCLCLHHNFLSSWPFQCTHGESFQHSGLACPRVFTTPASAIAKVSLARTAPFPVSVSHFWCSHLLLSQLTLSSALTLITLGSLWVSQSCHCTSFSLHLTPFTSSFSHFSVLESIVRALYAPFLIYTVSSLYVLATPLFCLPLLNRLSLVSFYLPPFPSQLLNS